MWINKKALLMLFILFTITHQNLFSQSNSSAKAQLKVAEQQYKKLHYLSAIAYLKPVLTSDSSNARAQELMADSQRNLRNYDEALLWYSKLTLQPNVKPQWVLYYAEALANKEKYEESEKWYRKYLSLVPADKRASSFIKAGAASFQGNSDWSVFQTDLNTAASDYSPAWYKKGLLFISNRKPKEAVKNVFGWDQTPFSDIYVVDDLTKIGKIKIDSNSLTFALGSYKSNDDDTDPTSNDSKTIGIYNPKPFSTQQDLSTTNAYRLNGSVKSKFHEGPAVISPDGTLFFTRNNYSHLNAGRSKDGVNKLKLYQASGTNWTKVEELPFNSDEYSTGHP
ncbi:MAG: flagellar motor protein MotB, partial [Pyrinomonadaceae bacterium]|nr:flagellar motor protein MotB [Sphingobacteriaceae bacterium]